MTTTKIAGLPRSEPEVLQETPTIPKSKSLASKLAEVVLLVSHVEKRGHNDFHNYDYATAADVLDAVRTGLAQRSIAIIPRITSVDVKEKPREGKAPQFIVTTQQTYAILDGESGEVLEVPWFGCGEDSGDKGIYKALTGGYKYFLLQLFMIPTGDDPERETKKQKGAKGEPANVSPDASAILDLAAALQQITGVSPDKAIEAASAFTKEGKVFSFSDPTTQKSAKWLKNVRERLERELKEKGAKAAVGDTPLPF